MIERIMTAIGDIVATIADAFDWWRQALRRYWLLRWAVRLAVLGAALWLIVTYLVVIAVLAALAGVALVVVVLFAGASQGRPVTVVSDDMLPVAIVLILAALAYTHLKERADQRADNQLQEEEAWTLPDDPQWGFRHDQR